MWTLQSRSTSVKTLSVPVPADRAGGLEGIAHQHDAGAAIAGVGAEIDGRILMSPETANGPVIGFSRGSAAVNVSAGARRKSRSQGSSKSR